MRADRRELYQIRERLERCVNKDEATLWLVAMVEQRCEKAAEGTDR